MKKFFALSLMCLFSSVSAYGASVTVNSEPIDKEPVIIDGRTLVPVRGVFEKIGFTVSYDAQTKTAELKNGSDIIIMTNGNTYFTVNGEKIFPDVAQQIIDGSFMLPLRAVGEAVNAEVSWDSETKTASINTAPSKTGLTLNDGINIIEF